MGTVHQLRPASVSVFATERDDRPIAIQIGSRSSTSSALLTVPEAMALHSLLGQLIRDALPPAPLTSSDAFAVVAGAAHDLAPALTGGRCSDCVGHDGACGMVSPCLLHTQSRAADGSKSGTPRAGEEG